MPLSPLTLTRIKKFKTNKRAFISSIVFAFLFISTLLADLLANDKPLYVYYEGKSFFPIFKFYSEKTFGGEFETQANFKDPFVKNLIAQKGFMVMPPIPFSYDTINYDLQEPAPASPTYDNWLGTDDQGRDVLARLLYGLRISLVFGVCLTPISYVFGILAGAVQGY